MPNHTMSQCLTPFLKTLIKSALPGLRQFLAAENPLKMIKSAFYFTMAGDGGGRGVVGQKDPSLKSVTHILQ